MGCSSRSLLSSCCLEDDKHMLRDALAASLDAMLNVVSCTKVARRIVGLYEAQLPGRTLKDFRLT